MIYGLTQVDVHFFTEAAQFYKALLIKVSTGTKFPVYGISAITERIIPVGESIGPFMADRVGWGIGWPVFPDRLLAMSPYVYRDDPLFKQR